MRFYAMETRREYFILQLGKWEFDFRNSSGKVERFYFVGCVLPSFMSLSGVTSVVYNSLVIRIPFYSLTEDSSSLIESCFKIWLL